MDFYIDGGGGGSTGGLPTGWDTGSPGVTGGGGGVPSISLDSYSSLLGADTVKAYYAAMSNPDVMDAQKEHLNSLANNVMSLSRTRDFSGYNKAQSDFMMMAYNPYSYKPPNLAVDPKQMGFSAVKPLGSEEALLSEYGRGYAGPTYNADVYSGKYSNSDYSSWLNKQKEQYDTAKQGLADYENNKPLAPPGPWVPNGAPDAPVAWPEPWKTPTYEAELMQLLHDPKLAPYTPHTKDWNGSVKAGNLSGLFGGNKNFNPFSKLASQYDSPSFTSSGLLAQTMAKGMEGADPQRNSSNPWQSTNLIKPASYFDESSQGIAPPKGLMGQDMITQNNVLPALQMASMNSQSMPEGNEALDAATKPLSEAQDKGNATDKIQEARNKWKSDSLNKFGNWQSLA